MIRITIFLIALFSLSTTGCTTCPHRASYDALHSEIATSTCSLQRNKVVAILVGTDTILDFANLNTLAKRLNEAGFARIYRGGIVHGAWLKREIERTHADDPETRFVVIGYDWGARTARELTCQMTASGIPVDSLVLLDPLGVGSVEILNETCRVSVIRSHGWMNGSFPDAVDTTVPGIGHIDLPTHAETLATIVGVLETTAGQIPMANELSFPNRPTHLGADWDFLLGPSNNSNPSSPPPTKSVPERTAKIAAK